MAKSDFEKELDAVLALDEPRPKAYTEMYQRLEQLAASLERSLSGNGHKIQVVLEPGHLVNVGQQFNVVVQIPTLNNFRDVLFRAYLPPEGKPVTLDLTGEEPVQCTTPKALEKKILDFLALDAIRARLRTLRDLAAKKTN